MAEMNIVEIPQLTRMPAAESGEAVFEPQGAFPGAIEKYGYVSQEWIATGEVDGHPYSTVVFVRRPGDPKRFSGTLIVEPLHATSAAPVWIYTSEYQMRSGHAAAVVYSQKSPVDANVKPANPARYASVDIWSDWSPDDAPSDGEGRAGMFQRLRRANVLSTPILAQVGAALRMSGPLEDWNVKHLILVGHSQTGGVVTDYILNAHDSVRFPGGRAIYDGLFPAGAPGVQFRPRDVPLVQTLSEGDISDPRRAGREGRRYRRPDSDDAADRYRLYELAGVPHMGTRYPPYNDATMWAQASEWTGGSVSAGSRMNSMPHGEMFSMTLNHLVRWVVDDVVPPRADRIRVAPDGLLLKDEFGNSVGGVRSAQLDVPRLKYYANPGIREDGSPLRGVVGIEEPLPAEALKRLYPSRDAYVEAFNRRIDELVAEGWLLPEDVDAMKSEAANATL